MRSDSSSACSLDSFGSRRKIPILITPVPRARVTPCGVADSTDARPFASETWLPHRDRVSDQPVSPDGQNRNQVCAPLLNAAGGRAGPAGRGRAGQHRGMKLPVMPPVAPMLAKSVKDLPVGPLSYEPKWDGFRSVIFRDGDEVEIGSRNERPMTRYFPELVSAVLANLPERCVIDGEVVVPNFTTGRLDFEALQLRIHPAASRVKLLAEQTPAHFIAFDLLALGDTDYMASPFAARRAALEQALAGARSPVHLTPATADKALAIQ